MPKGSLIIAGGAIKAASAQIFGELVRRAGGSGGRFALIPAATVKPAAAFKLFANELGALGVAREQIELVEVSPAVPGWQDGARQPSELAKIEHADGIWIAGGNQNNIIKTLLDEDLRDSPMASLLRERLQSGAVIGGTSAGAAVMSDIMIGGGTSYGALALPRAKAEGCTEISDALYVTRGLGLFPLGIVDQHFDSRARLGRLLEAAIIEGKALRPAFGIAEDSALVWDAALNRITAIGSGGICIAEVGTASYEKIQGQSRLGGVVLHYLSRGDSWNPDTGTFLFPEKCRIATTDAQFEVPRPESSGVFSPYGSLVDFIANLLLDNRPEGLFVDSKSGLRYIRSYLIAPEPALAQADAGGSAGAARPHWAGAQARAAWELRFGYLPGCAELWYGGQYAFTGVRVEIVPAEIMLKIL